MNRNKLVVKIKRKRDKSGEILHQMKVRFKAFIVDLNKY